MKAIVMNGPGGCEMLEYVERPDPVAGPGQALVEVAVAGVNFLDTGVRQGTLRTDVPNPRTQRRLRRPAQDLRRPGRHQMVICRATIAARGDETLCREQE